ncbi:synaptic vesicle glycoprotein 2B-like [Ostrinia nubilalis]|uniref:synaptic vesicle glycoprotein 2B-like n=1 Tax=Ostrinia nubilalis TaxID=29057 RepID=UPI0030824063
MCDASSIEFTAKCAPETKQLRPVEELDQALKECKFGRFHLRLLLTSLVRNIAGNLVHTSTPFLLTSAECDLKMDLVDKGLLNAMPYVGMAISAVGAGFLTDTFGRKKFILCGYFGIFVMMSIAGCSQTYSMLVIAKFFEGFLFGIAHTASVTLMSEFCHQGIRDQIMLCQFSFVSLAQVSIALMSWGVLTQEWRYTIFNGYLAFNTWNFYLIIMAQWSFLAWLLQLFIPESPKYLLTQHKYEEAREILITIYKENTGKSAETFQYVNLWKNMKRTEDEPKQPVSGFSHHLVMGLRNVKLKFTKPLALRLTQLCMANVMILSLYNVLRLWFPQISTIVEHYSDKGADLCVMLDSYTEDLKTRATNTTGSDVCIPIKSGPETYINSVIIGLVCFLPYCINGVLVKRLGKKPLSLGGGVIAIGGILALRWASSKTAVVSLFSINAAVLQSMTTNNFVFTMEIFPTSIRAFATSIVMTMGRFGTLIGNVSFPVLLNMGCSVPFFTMTGLMVCVVIISCFLPGKKKQCMQ